MSARDSAPRARADRSVTLWRTAVFTTFAASGVAFTSWVARTPDIRGSLDISNATVGWIIFGLSAGSIVSLTLSGRMVARFGGRRVVAVGASLIGLGIVVVGLGTGLGSVPLVAIGMILTGLGFGTSEVALNIEGAAIEAILERSILPSLHGSYSLGALTGAGIGVLAILADVPVMTHLMVVGAAAVIAPFTVLRFLPPATGRETGPAHEHATMRERLSVWREPRTLLAGVVVLGMAFGEGAANDWLPLAIVDGYRFDASIGSTCFALFAGAMTIGRLTGGRVVDRFGRVRSLAVSAVLAIIGILLVILGGTVLGASIVALIAGSILWGFGVALGFPLGISAAADQEEGRAARVGATATVGYFAFLVGPPAIGFLGEQFGLLESFVLVLVLMAISGLASRATRPLAPSAGAQPTVE